MILNKDVDLRVKKTSCQLRVTSWLFISNNAYYDKIPLKRDAYGKGGVVVSFPRIGLLRGEYKVHVLLMCEQAIYTYDTAIAADLVVEREGLEVGVVVLPRSWNEA